MMELAVDEKTFLPPAVERATFVRLMKSPWVMPEFPITYKKTAGMAKEINLK